MLFGWSFWIGLPLGGLVAAFFGFLVAWPALRVHDHYLALVTLGYGLIMNLLHRNLTFLTNGTDGVINIPPPAIGGYDFIRPIAIGGFNLPFQANFYYLALALAGITVLVSVRLRNSNLGRQWEAIREEEVAARCFGINVTARKVVALTTGAFFGGIGGATFAHMIGFVHPDNFVLLTSITILAMVIIGGMGNIYGVIVGAGTAHADPGTAARVSGLENAALRRGPGAHHDLPAAGPLPERAAASRARCEQCRAPDAEGPTRRRAGLTRPPDTPANA